MLDNCMKKEPWHKRIPPEFYTASDKLVIGLLLVAVSLHFANDLFQTMAGITAAANFYLVIYYVLRYVQRRRRRVTIRFDKFVAPKMKDGVHVGILAEDIVTAQPLTKRDVPDV